MIYFRKNLKKYLTFPCIPGYIVKNKENKGDRAMFGRMFVTFETEKTFITVDISTVQSFDTESLVRFACEQIGLDDYVDFFDPSTVARCEVVQINWRPLINRCRQETAIKRPIRKFARIPNWLY